MKNLNEPILEDNYPIHKGYLYIVNNKVIRSTIEGNVKSLKQALKVHEYLKVEEVRKCDIGNRNLWHLMI